MNVHINGAGAGRGTRVWSEHSRPVAKRVQPAGCPQCRANMRWSALAWRRVRHLDAARARQLLADAIYYRDHQDSCQVHSIMVVEAPPVYSWPHKISVRIASLIG